MRYHKLFTCVAVLAACTLSACNNRFQAYPRAVTFPGIEQPVARSAAHWDLMAAQEAQLVTAMLAATGAADSAALHVRSAGIHDSPFEQAYARMLTSHLVAGGASMVMNPLQASLYLDYDILVVEHHKGRNWRPRTGFFSAAFAVAAVAGNVANWEDNELALIPLGLGLDALTALWRDTRETLAEVIVTATLHDGAELHLSDTRVYYIRDADLTNYQTRGKTFHVVGGL